MSVSLPSILDKQILDRTIVMSMIGGFDNLDPDVVGDVAMMVDHYIETKAQLEQQLRLTTVVEDRLRITHAILYAGNSMRMEVHKRVTGSHIS